MAAAIPVSGYDTNEAGFEWTISDADPTGDPAVRGNLGYAAIDVEVTGGTPTVIFEGTLHIPGIDGAPAALFWQTLNDNTGVQNALSFTSSNHATVGQRAHAYRARMTGTGTARVRVVFFRF